MRKKFWIPALFLLSLLSGCTLPSRQYNPLDENNYIYNLADRTDYRSLSAKLLTLPSGYTLSNYDPENCRRGFLEVIANATGKKGCFSLFDGSFIVPCQYMGFTFDEDPHNGTYIFALNADGTRDVYDYRGYLVDAGVSDPDYSVETSIAVLDYKKEHLVEIVTQNGVQRQQEILSNRTRVSFVTPCDLLLKSSRGFLPLQSSLENVALANYVGAIDEEGHFKVTKGNKIVSEFQIPSKAASMAFFWKSFFYQTKEVATGSDYTYEEAGTRYVLKSYRIQLADGLKSELSIPAVLSPIRPIYDDLGQAKWLLATVYPIIDHRLTPSRRYVFNNDGEVVFNTANNPAYSDNVLLLKWNTIYSSDGAVMDRYFEKTATLAYPVASISYPTSSFVSFHDNEYGVMGYDGKQIFSNDYTYIHLEHPYNNCGFSLKGNDYYSLNPVSGQTRRISLNNASRLDDLALGVNRVSTLEDDGSYQIHYLFYDGSLMEHFFWRLPDSSTTLTTYFDDLVVDAYHDSAYAWQSFSLRER